MNEVSNKMQRRKKHLLRGVIVVLLLALCAAALPLGAQAATADAVVGDEAALYSQLADEVSAVPAAGSAQPDDAALLAADSTNASILLLDPIQTCTVTYYSSGSQPVTENFLPSGSQYVVKSPTDVGFTHPRAFLYWRLNDQDNGTIINPGDTITLPSYVYGGENAVVLYANWAPPVYNSRFVTYRSTFSGYEGGLSIPVPLNTPYTIASLSEAGVPTPPGQKFLGWSLVDGGDVAYNVGDVITFTTDGYLEIYAKWEPLPTYKVTYNGNGSTSGRVPVDGNSYFANASVRVLGNPGSLAKSGYTLAGWNTQADGSGTTYTAGNTFNITSNTTLYAVWSPVSPTLYTVVFDTHGGTPTPVSQRVEAGKYIAAPASPTLTGYSFTGWYTAASGGTRWNFSSNAMPARTLTLHAQYVRTPYMVTFNYNGAGASRYVNAYYGDLISNPGNPTRSGYTFGGWADEGNSFWNFATRTMPARNITLTAIWNAAGTPASSGTASATSAAPAASSAAASAASAASTSTSGQAGGTVSASSSSALILDGEVPEITEHIDGDVPLGRALGSWSLLNLILCVAGIIVAGIMLVRWTRIRTKMRLIFSIITTLLVVAGTVVFLLISDFTTRMVFTDWLSVFLLISAAVQVLLVLLYIHNGNKEKNQDEDAASPA